MEDDQCWNELSGERPVVEVFNLQQIVMAIGESAGAFSGGALFSLAVAHHQQPLYWLGLAVTAAMTTTAAGIAIRRATLRLPKMLSVLVRWHGGTR